MAQNLNYRILATPTLEQQFKLVLISMTETFDTNLF